MTQFAAFAGLAAFAWLAVFQLLLAAGAPLGGLAWGGRHRVLPPSLRVSSLVSAGIGLLGAATLAQAAGLGPERLPNAIVRPLLGGLAGLFAVSLLGNLMSRSRAERIHGVPLAAVLAICCAVVAIG